MIGQFNPHNKPLTQIRSFRFVWDVHYEASREAQIYTYNTEDLHCCQVPDINVWKYALCTKNDEGSPSVGYDIPIYCNKKNNSLRVF